MLKQMLITLAVAVIVVLIARMKRNRSASRVASPPSAPSKLTTTMMIGYALAALTILATAGISWMRYQEANTIVRVEVVDTGSGQRTIYQVRRKELGDREFKTVDGRVVSLGAADRMERIE